MIKPLFLAFGGNLGSPRNTISEAISILSKKLQSNPVISSFYVTKAMTIDGAPGPEYVNCVGRFESNRDAPEVLNICLEVERALGRIRESEARWGSRVIDIDIISYGDFVISSPNLTIPHPGLTDRDFVLVPLAEIEPEWVHPVTGKTAAELLENLSGERFILKEV